MYRDAYGLGGEIVDFRGNYTELRKTNLLYDMKISTNNEIQISLALSFMHWSCIISVTCKFSQYLPFDSFSNNGSRHHSLLARNLNLNQFLVVYHELKLDYVHSEQHLMERTI